MLNLKRNEGREKEKKGKGKKQNERKEKKRVSGKKNGWDGRREGERKTREEGRKKGRKEGKQEGEKEGSKETFYIMTRTSWELKVNSSKETNILIVALRFMTLVRTSMTLKFTF